MSKVRSQPRERRASAIALKEVALCIDDAPLRHRLVEYLHRIQDTHGCLTHDHLLALAEHLAAAPVEVFETASFYHTSTSSPTRVLHHRR